MLTTADSFKGKKIARIEYRMEYDKNPKSIVIIFEDEPRKGSVYSDTPTLEVFAGNNEIELSSNVKDTDNIFLYGIDNRTFYRSSGNRST